MLPARRKAQALVLRGEKLLLAKNATAAEPLLKRAAALDPSLPDAWRNLGIARATLGDSAGARVAYRKYLKLAPDAPDAAEVRQILGVP
jgi:Flp pilus assembly protein TadD